jgi:predicted NBD/HSP70 family sugar kinase
MDTKQLYQDLIKLERKHYASTGREVYQIGNKMREIKVDLITALAIEFSRGINRYLTPDQLAEAIAKNQTPDYNEGICATHDYIDANEVMSEAFTTITGKEVDVQNDIDRDLWSKAWSLSKANNFKNL